MRRKAAIAALVLTVASGAQAATARPRTEGNVVKRLLIWVQGKLIPPLPSPEPTSAPADQTRQGS